MKESNIYVGTIKKCNNSYFYNKYGEEKYIGDFIVGHTRIETKHSYVDLIDDHAILIKINENKYIWIKDIKTFYDKIRFGLGVFPKVINTVPENDGELFVVKKSLIPYFKNSENKNISVKTLKKRVAID